MAPAAEMPVEPTQLSEVVITARKRDERLLDVPLAVSVLDRNALEEGGVRGLADIAARVPGLSFEPGILLPIPILRGQWQPSIAGDNVGIFVDGVYQANRTAIDVELLDLARVEVVPGPQSALVFCGVSGTNRVSSFCSLGPPRNPALGAPALVPWIDGNFVGRVPRLTWHTALLLGALPMGAGWQLRTRLDADYQSDKFERAIEALRFGRRLLVDARWTLQRAAWSVELWGRNLGNTVYISTSAGQSPQFYPSTPSRATVPRPMHVVVGEGRRFGLTLRYVR